jgi:hypothetical protein
MDHQKPVFEQQISSTERVSDALTATSQSGYDDKLMIDVCNSHGLFSYIISSTPYLFPFLFSYSREYSTKTYINPTLLYGLPPSEFILVEPLLNLEFALSLYLSV